VGARFLDADARAAFKRAIETIETASAAEVVVAVRRRSDRYLHVNVIVGAVVAFAGLALALFASRPFGLTAILVDPFILGLGAGALVEVLPHVKRGLTWPTVRRARVLRAARAAFVERGVHHTRGRSGVLVYIAWTERIVALVPDGGLARAIESAELVRAEDQLSAAVKLGGAEVARRLEAFAPVFARAMPHQDDDENELPDAIDSDLEAP
jgi:putative membrane protein